MNAANGKYETRRAAIPAASLGVTPTARRDAGHSTRDARAPGKNFLETELLILPDGQILVHNLTQPFAELLKELNPDCEQISSRAAAQPGTQNSELKTSQ